MNNNTQNSNTENLPQGMSLVSMLLVMGGIAIGVLGSFVMYDNRQVTKSTEEIMNLSESNGGRIIIRKDNSQDGFEMHVDIVYVKEDSNIKVPNVVVDYTVFTGKHGSYVIPNMKITLSEKQRNDKELINLHQKFLDDLSKYSFSMSKGTEEFSKNRTLMENEYKRDVLKIEEME